jgi:hypothetical protein
MKLFPTHPKPGPIPFLALFSCFSKINDGFPPSFAQCEVSLKPAHGKERSRDPPRDSASLRSTTAIATNRGFNWLRVS